MKSTSDLRHSALLWAGLLLAACSAPKYAHYTSPQRDWRADVPWGWTVLAENDGARYGNTALVGPFEPDFYLGVPSFQVRWYAYGAPHRLRDGETELYPGVDAYIQQTLDLTYGKNRQFENKAQAVEQITVGGRKARYFVVVSPRAAPAWAKWGTSINKEDGSVGILRKHAYTIIPLQRGFYVLIYPATVSGYKLYEKKYNELVSSFTPLTEGPGGPPAAAPPAARKPL